MDILLSEITGEAGLRALLAVAVADATPEETMPPFDGPPDEPPGWTEAKQAFFLEFFRPVVDSPETAVFTIMADRQVAGFIRLRRMAEPGVAETGMWLGRSFRGKGIGAAAFDALLAEAGKRGYTRVIADTKPQNVAALGVLRHGRASTHERDGKIYAEIAVNPANDPAYAADAEK